MISTGQSTALANISAASAARDMALGTLPRLAKSRCLRPSDLAAIQSAFIGTSANFSEFGRSLMLAALIEAELEFDEALIPVLLSSTNARDGWLQVRAYEALARRVNLPSELLAQVGLQLTDTGVNVAHLSEDPWAAYEVALFYLHNRERFAEALVAILNSGGWSSVAQVLGILTRDRVAHGRLPLQSVNAALLARAVGRTTSSYAELDLLESLGQLAPAELIASSLLQDLDRWMPEARASLMRAMGQAVSVSELRDLAVQRLLHNANDSDGYVRQCAQSALARLAPSDLARWCENVAQSPHAMDRQAVAEALALLPSDAFDQAHVLIAELRADREPSVRRRLAEVLDRRRNASWADAYFDQLAAATHAKNPDVLRLWRYGKGLANTGQQRHLEALQKISSNVDLDPSHRWWLMRISKELQTRLGQEDATSNQRYALWRGSVEEVTGVLPATGGRIRLRLWFKPAQSPGTWNEWGGASRDLGFGLGLGEEDEPLAIRLDDSREGQIQVLHSSLGVNWSAETYATFSGLGEYPGERS